jgi:histidinol-phosphate aminotransferase
LETLGITAVEARILAGTGIPRERPIDVLRFRPDLDRVATYTPGRPVDEVAREMGIDDIVKLASNEHPEPPLPGVQAVIAEAAALAHRYPDNAATMVADALNRHYGLPFDHFWVGAGSSELLGCIALAVGGPGTSAVFADPSFAMYPIGTAVAGAEAIRVPLDAEARHDLDAMFGAIRDDTTVVYVCNPNNPTGTHLASDAVSDFIDRVPDDILIVVDEAYAEYATAPDFAGAFPLIADHPNVVVLRTFSKAYGLAGLRIGYAIGSPGVLPILRKPQRPFTVIDIAQKAAVASLRHTSELAARVKTNAVLREELEAAFTERGIPHVTSQTNFVLFTPPHDTRTINEALLRRGVIVRTMDPNIRVSVGTPEENARFLAALDEVLES